LSDRRTLNWRYFLIATRAQHFRIISKSTCVFAHSGGTERQFVVVLERGGALQRLPGRSHDHSWVGCRVFSWGISSITVSGGQTISVTPASILLLVGPNSSGKTVGLFELREKLAEPASPPRRVVHAADMFSTGTRQDLLDWLRQNYGIVIGGQQYIATSGAGIADAQLASYGDEPFTPAVHLPGLAPFLVLAIDTGARLTLCNYVDSIDLAIDPPRAYVHVLQRNEALHREISSEVRATFGFDLVIERTAGKTIGFRLGDEPAHDTINDHASRAYADAVSRLPKLESEGEGVRSFVATLLAAYCGVQPVLIVDEPEIFLHPPQARRLGGLLARSAMRLKRQVVVATHSADLSCRGRSIVRAL
jgi:hypothetical protein